MPGRSRIEITVCARCVKLFNAEVYWKHGEPLPAFDCECTCEWREFNDEALPADSAVPVLDDQNTGSVVVIHGQQGSEGGTQCGANE